MKPQIKPRSILLSKRANVFYLEHVRVMQKDERVVYLTETGEDVERFFNIPERNTAFVLLGKGTSITDAAARRLADANVLVGFCGSGGSPLFSVTDITFLAPQSEYRPTEYMQAWVKAWFDEPRRLKMAKHMLRQRLEWTLEAWSDNAELLKRHVTIPDSLLRRFDADVGAAESTQALLLAESHWAKALYAELARGLKLEFRREEGKGTRETKADVINGFLDHGNYIAYGYAATVLNGLGISFSLPLLHGKTRRGALVFDVADLVKDAFVMPAAFLMGAKKVKQQDFRSALIETCQKQEILDRLFTFVSELPQKSL
ncbi:type I-F CRISPR-associated endonuclease Cas1f [Methylocaldum sp.]|jgi:CRISPR-associated protein Cas1|uniref:type I-F CRISPR-associated endonuclease Cas1f n=1 Tax=Methylocaldum sp. TaxID=1969727 RepID=UPI0032203855